MAETRGFTHRDGCTAISCGKCEAEPGQPCMNATRSLMVPVHDERIEEYRRLVFAAVASYEEEGLLP